MEDILRGYSVNDATWFYLSSLLICAVFFRFNRVFSLRNLDLTLLMSITPGLLLVQNNYHYGYAWLFVVTGLLLVRLFCDSFWKRRPLLEQNLNPAGMAFLAVSAFVFLISNVLNEPLTQQTVETVRRTDEMLKRQDTTQEQSVVEEAPAGPTARLLMAPVVGTSDFVVSKRDRQRKDQSAAEQWAARTTTVLAHFAVIAGLWFLGRNIFGDAHTGLAMAALYLLLPCTSLEVGKVVHVLPAALIIWAFVTYRTPLLSGIFLGLACGTLLFPIFLLPLWGFFYGRQGSRQFLTALGIVAVVLIGSLLLTSADSHSFTKQIIGSIDWSSIKLESERVGFWSTHDNAYRGPVIVAFFVMLLTLTFLPREKNLEHLLGHSTAIIVATQLWYPQQRGTYVLWYLPLLLAVVFRPKLANQTSPFVVRPALEEQHLSGSVRMVVSTSWFRRSGP
jgi:hypothetical protein